LGVVEDCRFQRGGSLASDQHWLDGVFVHRVAGCVANIDGVPEEPEPGEEFARTGVTPVGIGPGLTPVARFAAGTL
jgi:hypothetical protein